MTSTTAITAVVSQNKTVVYDINVPYNNDSRQTFATKYPHYLPTFDKIWFEPLPLFDFVDPALRADPIKPNFLGKGVTLRHITPRMGSIVDGIQLTTLSDAAKDELALLICERKVLAFPDQDFIDAGPQFQQDFMKYFGKPNYQPVSGTLPGYPGFHIIHREGNKEEIDNFLSKHQTTCLWHQDVSYERQPPGYVALGMLHGPSVGGDTVFAATDMAYKRLSRAFREKLDDIKVVHSSQKMCDHTAAAGGLVRKAPVESVHPLIRVHPVTKEKCIFINGEFATGFQGMKDGEFKALTNFLLQHIISGHDFQARVQWTPRTVVLFDNRSTLHTAVVDYLSEDNVAEPRHIFRLASMAEVPISVDASG